MDKRQLEIERDRIINGYVDLVEAEYEKAKEEGRVGYGLGKDIPEIIALKKECGRRLKDLYEKMNK